ncbi:MAG: hypothetical protein AAF479_15405 [Pseudomonadota bacterium]
MTDKTQPTEIDDADLDVANGGAPDLKIRTASTAGTIDMERVMGVRVDGVRKTGVRKNGIRDNGVRLNGVRLNGVRANGSGKKG